MLAIQVKKTGGPEVLEAGELKKPEPGPGQALVRVEAIGVNFIDVYHCSGLYKVDLPFTPGAEGAGVVEAVGPDVQHVKVGGRVAWAGGLLGAYAEYAVIPDERLVPIPDGIDAKTAAAAMLQGMTAHYLSHSTYPLKASDTVLVHAAAGGVGGLLIQVARLIGAKIYGTVSSDEKAAIAREAGADEVILYTREDFEEVVMRLTQKRGVDVVYDSVGKTTFDKSLNCVARRGMLVMFGQSSGAVPPFDLLRLSKNAGYLTRPSLHHYTATRPELLKRATDVFSWIRSGKLRLRIDREMPLRDARKAHELLLSRQVAGKLLLIP